MTKRPGDTTPEPPGGGAAERLREFLEQRFPGGDLPGDDTSDATGGEEPPTTQDLPGEPGGSSAAEGRSGEC